MKVAILTGASLSWNPRALKEAAALARAGHEVVVIGSNWDGTRFRTDLELARRHGFRFESAIRTSRDGHASRWRTLAARARGRIGKSLFKALGRENAWQIGPIAPDLLRAALRARADYYIAHNEQGLWAGCELLRRGFRVGVDMEDWYSDDLPAASRKERPVRLLRELEGRALRGAAHSSCPSRAMSEALARAYSCSAPAVVYNAFPWSDRDRLDQARIGRCARATPSIHWVSQVLGPARGLEDLFACLPKLREPVEIHLRGHQTGGLEAWLSSAVPASWRPRIFLHDPVGNDDLLASIAEHDIGFAGEMKYCASRDLTVTNKILHYLLAGCAVAASDTAGQSEVAQAAAGGVFLYPSGDSAALAEVLNSLLASPERLEAAKRAALDAARRTFCWEHQEPTLLRAIAQGANAR